MSAGGFFILLGISVLFRWLGNRLVPLVMPAGGKLKLIALGWLGGLVGSLIDRALWRIGPEVGGINVGAAAIGCALAFLIFGIVPFIRIMLGKSKA